MADSLSFGGTDGSSLTGAKRIVLLDNSVQTGQSVGQGTNINLNQPAYDFAALSSSGGSPATSLDGPNPSASLAVYRYPGDTPPYYMMLPISNYNRDSWASVGKLNEFARIILPLPQQMIDNHNVRYAIEELGYAGGAGFEAAKMNLAQAGSLGGAAIAQSGLSQLADKAGNFGAGLKKAYTGSLTAAGVSVNEFMTVMLKGPDYKRRDFVWRFSPKSAQETSDLRRIIQLINNSIAPSFSSTFGSAFFKWPKLWKPEFVYNGQSEVLGLNTFRMKPSVVTDFSVNYTPNGTFSPFARTKAPTSVDVHITFLELEYWLAGDFDDGAAGGTSTNAHDGSFNSSDIKNAFDFTNLSKVTGLGLP